jgi:hypothetical protein
MPLSGVRSMAAAPEASSDSAKHSVSNQYPAQSLLSNVQSSTDTQLS